MTASNCTPSLKICTKCGIEYPNTTEYFHTQKRNGKSRLIARCKACIRTKAKEWYESNREYAIEQAKKYVTTRPEETKAIKQRYYEKNKQDVIDRAAVWLKAHKELRNHYSRVHAARRRAWKRESPGKSYTRKDVELQFKSQKGKCWHCGKSIADYYEVDHLIALSRGGSNAANNIVLACKPCNRGKSDKLPQEWNGRLF